MEGFRLMITGSPKTKEIIIKKVGDEMHILDILRVRIKEKDLIQYNISEKDLNKYIDRMKAILEAVPEDFPYKKPIAEDFKYPDPKPYDYDVPIPKVDEDKLLEDAKESLKGAIDKVDVAPMIAMLLDPDSHKGTVDYFVKMIENVFKQALSKVDWKSFLKEVLGEIDLPIPKKVDGEEIVVNRIKKGRTVIEYDIRKREKMFTFKGFRLQDEKGESLLEVDSGIDDEKI